MFDRSTVFQYENVIVGIKLFATRSDGFLGSVLELNDHFLGSGVLQGELERSVSVRVARLGVLVSDGLPTLIIVGDGHLFEGLLEASGREEEDTIVLNAVANLSLQSRGPLGILVGPWASV